MSYKDDQKATHEALKPRVISSGSPFKRNNRRRWDRVRLTKAKTPKAGSVHVVNDYAIQREDNKFPPGPTNHQRMLIRKERRDDIRVG